jgi:exodeoxyribonuclease V alpha subunit
LKKRLPAHRLAWPPAKAGERRAEFPAIIIPLAMQQCVLLQRDLVYTGITRGKKLVALIGQRKALGMAVRNNRNENRFSGLLARLTMPGS